MKTVVVELGGRGFEVRELPMRASRAWRERLGAPMREVVQRLQGAAAMEVTDVAGIGDLIEHVGELVLGSVEIAADLVFEYSPELAAERDWIEEQVYDSEMMAAFVEVLKLAYPFGKMLSAVSSGLEKTETRKK